MNRFTALVRVVLARLYFHIGWPGCVGALCCMAGAALLMMQPHLSAESAAPVTQLPDAAAAVVNAPPAEKPRPDLPLAADTVQVLKRMKASIQGSGLAWPQASYKLIPVTDEALATLEVTTTLKGPYPKIRQLLADLLAKEPSLALRELSLTRANGDTPEIEAKIHWAVFLSDGWGLGDQRSAP